VTRRSLRAAVVIPALFAFADEVIKNANVSTFASIGAFATLLLADFGGPIRQRLTAYVALALAGAALVILGTLCSRTTWLAVVVAGVVAALVLFAGILSGYAAKGSTAVLLLLVLPLTIPAGASAIGPRLEGWALASLVGTLATLLWWREPPQAGIGPLAAASLDALGGALDAQLAGSAGAPSGDVAATVARTRAAYLSTTYPLGATVEEQAIVSLVQDLDWLVGLTSDRDDLPLDGYARAAEEDRELVAESVLALRHAASAMRGGAVPAEGGGASTLAELSAARVRAADAAAARVAASTGGAAGVPAEMLECSFHARAVATAAAAVASAALVASGAARGAPAVTATPLATSALGGIARQSLAHADLRSVWLRNSARGALGVALAVLVAKVTDVQHGFWVVLGTLAVLRSNALGTGATALRALAGTTVGFAVGAVLLVGLGDHVDALWAVLPVTVLLAGYAPARISFLAGQAAFTVLLAVLFNIVQPTGWRVGLVRVEDVAIGCAISLGVGLLLWPRGVAPVVSVDLADAYRSAMDYLSSAVHDILGRAGPRGTAQAADDAAASSRRLDAALRGYLAEQGPKVVHREELAALVAGSTRLSLTASSIASLAMRGRDGGSEADAIDRELHELAVSVGHVADGLALPSARERRRMAAGEALHANPGAGSPAVHTDPGERDGGDPGAGSTVASGTACNLWIHHHLSHLRDAIGPLADAASALPAEGPRASARPATLTLLARSAFRGRGARGTGSVVEDDAARAVPGHVVPRPVDEHDEAVAEAHEEDEVHG